MLPRSKTLITTLTGSVLALAAMTSVLQAACASHKSLGVSRTITVDARGGKLFGGLQYRANGDLLRDREVILTFDDGPARLLSSWLDEWPFLTPKWCGKWPKQAIPLPVTRGATEICSNAAPNGLEAKSNLASAQCGWQRKSQFHPSSGFRT